MIRTMRALLLFLALTACGPDISGTWEGNLTAVGACTDKEGLVKGGLSRWVITTGQRLTIEVIGGDCGEYQAEARGPALWEIQPTSCPPPPGANIFVITGGTIALTNSGALDVFLSDEIDGAGATCLADIEGQMARQ